MSSAMLLDDLLIAQGSGPRTIDLRALFGDDASDFRVQNSNGEVVSSAVVGADGQLTLDFGGLGHSDLYVIAKLKNGETVEDRFRVNVAGENAFMVAMIPDTQDYTRSDALHETWLKMTDWLAGNKDGLNIQFAANVGDLTYFNTPAEWERFEQGMRTLDGVLPYSLAVGNHDQATNGTAANYTTLLNNYFSFEAQQALDPTLRGTYDKEPGQLQNAYHTFEAPDGTKWMVLSVEFGVRDDVLRWAGEVVEQHLDHRVIFVTHAYNAGDGRVGPLTNYLNGENGGYGYGIRTNPESANDPEDIYRDSVAKYPNITFAIGGHNFVDGGQTQIDYTAGGASVFQMIVNYQNGVAREITGNGDSALGNNGGNGAIRMILIDPDNDRVTTQTYFVGLDDYLDGYRTTTDLDRDGLTGPYKDHQEVFENVDLGTPLQITIAKAGDDRLVEAEGRSADVTLDAGASIETTAGITQYLWLDAEGRTLAEGRTPTLPLEVGVHRLTLMAVDSEGRVSLDEQVVTVTGPGTLLHDDFNDGDRDGWVAQGSTSNSWLVKGTVHSQPAADGPAPEGKLWEQSDGTNRLLLWQPEENPAPAWSNYVFDATVHTQDNDTWGAVFYYQDAANHYRVTFDIQANQTVLTKVQDGVSSVLASVAAGHRFDADMALRIAVVEGDITVLLDGRNVFGGPVADAAPLSGGTVGFYANAMRILTIDDVLVNQAEVTATAEAPLRVLALAEDGLAEVALDGRSSFSPDGIITYQWSEGGTLLAEGAAPTLSLAAGWHELTLTVTDGSGRTHSEQVLVEVVGPDALLLQEGFAGPDAAWRFVDERELGDAADWQLQDGALLQLSNAHSRQLTTGGNASDNNLWNRGWSPLGDGDFALRKGTYALYDTPAARGWGDYSLEATLSSSSGGGLGLLFRYQDADNYYKLELDNAAWDGLIQLVKVVEGVETVLGRSALRYALGEEMRWRIDVEGGRIKVFIDEIEVFGTRIEERSLAEGTVGLYSWNNPGARFDDVAVVSLGAARDEGRTVLGDGQTVRLEGGSGDDLVRGRDLAEHLLGGSGDDLLQAAAGNDSLDGGGGNDTLQGGEGNDSLLGGAGYDSLLGGGGDDSVLGGSGNDTLVGADGADTLVGGTGDDQLHGRAGDDELLGGLGHDLANGGVGNDTLRGQSGDDTLLGGSGDDSLDGGSNRDRLVGGTGDDSLSGGRGDDTLLGDQGHDLLEGGEGDDLLRGGLGRDSLYGGAGNDTLVGGQGPDLLHGGAGADRFVMGLDDGIGDRPTPQTRILDFSSAEGDLIDLSRLDADSGTPGMQDFTFIGQGAFGGVAGQLRFVVAQGETRILGDIDGDATRDFVIRLEGEHLLQASDFLL